MYLLALLLHGTADAHHVVTDYAIASVQPRSYVGFNFDVGVFDEGNWQLGAVQAEYAPLPWLSIATRVPMARVHDDGETSFGLADIDADVKARVYETEHGGLVSVGLAAELPTGDPHEHLGGGHLELDPFVLASVQTLDDRLVLVGMVQEIVTVDAGSHDHDDEGDPEGLHGAPFALHADQELRVQATVAYVLGDGWASLMLEPIVPWAEAGPTVNVGVDAGIRFGQANVALGFSAPVAGVPRYEWRTNLNATMNF